MTHPDKKDQSQVTSNRTRRDFLKTAAAGTAAASIPYVWTSRTANAIGPNDQKTIACIGVGGSRGRHNRGGKVARKAKPLGRMIAVCDVDGLHTAEFNKEMGGELNEYTDYRKLFENENPDVVIIGTPDHWHVPISIRALRSGADVYCEKPLTLTIGEGEQIKQVVEETGRVFQVGTQQRSEMGRLFLIATAIVRSGRLGENVNAYVAVGGSKAGGPFENVAVPEKLDWDMWVGPAPKVDYSLERRQEFRWFLEYSGGKMTDWGAHHIDIAQWALQLDNTGPSRVSGTGNLPPIIPDNFNWQQFFAGDLELPNSYNAAIDFHIDLSFDSGSVISVNNQYTRGNIDFDNGILFEGDKGRMFVNRGKLQGKVVEEIFGSNLGTGNKKQFAALDKATRDEFEAAFKELHNGKSPMSHMDNFFACLEDRSKPVADVVSHVNTMNSCHLCNLNLMLGRDLQWDLAAGDFIGDDQASALRSRKRREGFEI